MTTIKTYTNLRGILSSILLSINDGGSLEREAVALLVTLMDRGSLLFLCFSSGKGSSGNNA
jgi:hypothetical protein